VSLNFKQGFSGAKDDLLIFHHRKMFSILPPEGEANPQENGLTLRLHRIRVMQEASHDMASIDLSNDSDIEAMDVVEVRVPSKCRHLFLSHS
jgi:hypothetical protein